MNQAKSEVVAKSASGRVHRKNKENVVFPVVTRTYGFRRNANLCRSGPLYDIGVVAVNGYRISVNVEHRCYGALQSIGVYVNVNSHLGENKSRG